MGADCYYDIVGTTLYAGIIEDGRSVIAVSDGRLTRRSGDHTQYVYKDDEDKLHQITPTIYALNAGNWNIVTVVLERLRSYKDDATINTEDMAGILSIVLKGYCDELRERGFKEENLTTIFVIVGFELGKPVILEVRHNYENARTIIGAIGVGSRWESTGLAHLDDENINQRSMGSIINIVRKSMVEASLMDQKSGGILRVRKLTHCGPSLLHKGHVLSSYHEYYDHFKTTDEKTTLFAVCGSNTHLYSVNTFFDEKFGEELLAGHVLGWLLSDEGYEEQFRRLQFLSNVADEVYMKLKGIASTEVTNTNGVEKLKVFLSIEDDKLNGKEPKNESEKIVVMKASLENLNHIFCDGFNYLTPARESYN